MTGTSNSRTHNSREESPVDSDVSSTMDDLSFLLGCKDSVDERMNDLPENVRRKWAMHIAAISSRYA